jgi:hypothetical protein
MRRLPFIALALVTACHRQAPAPPPRQQAVPVAHRAPGAQPSTAQPETRSAAGDTASAADLLRHYYGLIEAGKYDEAWKMRSGGRDMDAARFAAHFRAYESYHSQIGQPSLPVRSGDWLYVEVPVMTTGRFLGGKPFGSAGSVTLRRPVSGSSSPPGERGWRIYTG